jgi:hypothetical protein
MIAPIFDNSNCLVVACSRGSAEDCAGGAGSSKLTSRRESSDAIAAGRQKQAFTKRLPTKALHLLAAPQAVYARYANDFLCGTRRVIPAHCDDLATGPRTPALAWAVLRSNRVFGAAGKQGTQRTRDLTLHAAGGFADELRNDRSFRNDSLVRDSVPNRRDRRTSGSRTCPGYHHRPTPQATR